MHWYLALSGFEIYGQLTGKDLEIMQKPQETNRMAFVELSFNNETKRKQLEERLLSIDFRKVLSDIYGKPIEVAPTYPEIMNEKDDFENNFMRLKLLEMSGAPKKRFFGAIFSIFVGKDFGSENDENGAFFGKLWLEIERFGRKVEKQNVELEKNKLEEESKNVYEYFREQFNNSSPQVKISLCQMIVESLSFKIDQKNNLKTVKKRKRNNSDEKKLKTNEKAVKKILPFWEFVSSDNWILPQKSKINLGEVLSIFSSHPLPDEDRFTSFVASLSSLCDENGDFEIVLLIAEICKFSSENPIDIINWLKSMQIDLNFDSDILCSADNLSELLENEQIQNIGDGFIEFSELISEARGEFSPLFLNPSQISVEKEITTKMKQPILRKLGQIESKLIRLQFVLLKIFNKLLADSLQFINLHRDKEKTSLAGMIALCKRYVFKVVKIDFIDSVMSLTAIAQTNLPVVSINRLAIAEKSNSDTEINFSRDTHFGIAMRQLGDVKESHLRPQKPQGTEPYIAFEVSYKDQHVVGTAGPYRQFFSEISEELISKECNAFVPIDKLENRAKMLFVVNPDATSPADCKMFEMIGVFTGCCIRTEAKLSLNLADIFWKLLCGDTIELKDLIHVDSQLYLRLKSSKESKKDEFEKEELTNLLAEHRIEYSSEVTYENRREIISLIVSALLRRTKRQMRFVSRGIEKVVPIQILRILTWEEL
ncbi:hypothetical protein MHBO_001735, partial [Bonamia ostreae]